MPRPIIFGEIDGIAEGHWFEGRKEMMPSSFHRSWGRGIDGNGDTGASAIVLSVYDYDKFRIEFYGYHCLLISYHGKLVDHDLYQWVRLEEINALSMAPADIPLIDLINQ